MKRELSSIALLHSFFICGESYHRNAEFSHRSGEVLGRLGSLFCVGLPTHVFSKQGLSAPTCQPGAGRWGCSADKSGLCPGDGGVELSGVIVNEVNIE